MTKKKKDDINRAQGIAIQSWEDNSLTGIM